MRAEPHPEQSDRIQTLHRYDILDTPREQDFDEIVQLASRICEAPISVINIIDEDRQWFKAELGLGIRETPLETSICSHVILQDDFVEIPDTLADPRMADNPLCLDNPGLRFYAGARLLASNGLPLGTLCVLDNHPRALNDLQRETLRVLSRQVMKQLELRLALRNEADLRAEMDHRVKNSLQSTASIVRMYARNITDPAATEAFGAIQNRIEAIAAVHEHLQGTNDGSVDMADYFPHLATLLQRSAPDTLTIIGASDPIDLPGSYATNIGMIVSEFAANAIKHGYPTVPKGRIEITLRKTADQMLRLEARDDGVGSRLNIDLSETTGVGTRLVAAAASKLGGQLDHGLTSDGARMVLDFPRPS